MLLGQFECEIVSHHIRPRCARNGPQIILNFQLINKLNSDGTEEAVDGQVIRSKTMMITAKTVAHYSEFLAFLGFKGLAYQLDPSAGERFISLAGIRAIFYSKKSTYQDTSRENWNIVRSNVPSVIAKQQSLQVLNEAKKRDRQPGHIRGDREDDAYIKARWGDNWEINTLFENALARKKAQAHKPAPPPAEEPQILYDARRSDGA
jgi:hypothetical protein